ncbi:MULTISPECIES: HNH endonuclease domain-containing protein [Leptolyngbya]|uniref:HNH endonuclease domain-containing protein n=1 Tax=Leptolyngbya TaxID=47251 RepID=UPI001687AD05|nr:HNH endonuclease domain-containing protein [Leptolyngbya sp. FACHB-1624]MBD1859966.1 HNH endonuclease [Leptolyngbya sp. FACHB-1624]
MIEFTSITPTLEDHWRSIILFGRNSATYKFALAKALLDLAPSGQSFITWEELAFPFSQNISEHLKQCDKQGTSQSSKFLQACRCFNQGSLTRQELIEATVTYGFQNVIDAFHIVGTDDIPKRFFHGQRQGSKGIDISDNLFQLLERYQSQNLPNEVEARWCLVETAWQLDLATHLVDVEYGKNSEVRVPKTLIMRRKSVTSCRSALNGYQKGKCFYCFSDISILEGSPDLADVDHFFPYALMTRTDAIPNINGVWNLVLACQTCNRGQQGKFDRIPALHLLKRLHRRNEFLIDSLHPLRETLIAQTGNNESQRRSFLQTHYNEAKRLLIHTWQPECEYPPAF